MHVRAIKRTTRCEHIDCLLKHSLQRSAAATDTRAIERNLEEQTRHAASAATSCVCVCVCCLRRNTRNAEISRGRASLNCVHECECVCECVRVCVRARVCHGLSCALSSLTIRRSPPRYPNVRAKIVLPQPHCNSARVRKTRQPGKPHAATGSAVGVRRRHRVCTSARIVHYMHRIHRKP